MKHILTTLALCVAGHAATAAPIFLAAPAIVDGDDGTFADLTMVFSGNATIAYRDGGTAYVDGDSVDTSRAFQIDASKMTFDSLLTSTPQTGDETKTINHSTYVQFCISYCTGDVERDIQTRLSISFDASNGILTPEITVNRCGTGIGPVGHPFEGKPYSDYSGCPQVIFNFGAFAPEFNIETGEVLFDRSGDFFQIYDQAKADEIIATASDLRLVLPGGSILALPDDINEIDNSALPPGITYIAAFERVHVEPQYFQQVSIVPLPAGLPLLMAGLGAFGLLRRRKG